MTAAAETATGSTAVTDTMLTVVRGRPDDLELAAVAAVRGAMAQQADTTAPHDAAPGPLGGDGRARPVGTWRGGAGRHPPGPAGRALGMS
ncbi:acyl-CoA carboxylase epsilon subunit [Streptomyces umbrinus]|uniref:acyl-CoA carboxylase epsilon subunit n=1 Tax=Streptomyces umbrinus TaxID=67370 RepID=UPI003C2B39A3